MAIRTCEITVLPPVTYYPDASGPPNLDAMLSADEVRSIWYAVHRSPVTVARRGFPTRPRGYVSATRLIGAYAANKATAMECRARGDINNSACGYERICDAIYDRLPDYARTW
jgi:hypothetical protein